MRLVEEEIMRDGSGLHEVSGQEIAGYVLSAGTKKQYKGYARIADEDSLAFWTRKNVRRSYTKTMGPTSVIPGPTFHVGEVDSLAVVTYGMTPGAVVLILVGVGGIALAAVAISMQDINFGN